MFILCKVKIVKNVRLIVCWCDCSSLCHKIVFRFSFSLVLIIDLVVVRVVLAVIIIAHRIAKPQMPLQIQVRQLKHVQNQDPIVRLGHVFLPWKLGYGEEDKCLKKLWERNCSLY